MRRAIGSLALVAVVAVLTFLALPALGWTADTGAGVLTAGVDAGQTTVGTAQVWLDFLILNSEKIAALIGVVGGIALAIRAQVKLWRADAAGVKVTSAVTDAGCEGLVRPLMDSAPKGIKAIVKRWASIK